MKLDDLKNILESAIDEKPDRYGYEVVFNHYANSSGVQCIDVGSVEIDDDGEIIILEP